MAINRDKDCYEFRDSSSELIGRAWVENGVITGDNDRLVRVLRRQFKESIHTDVDEYFWEVLPHRMVHAHLSIHGVPRA